MGSVIGFDEKDFQPAKILPYIFILNCILRRISINIYPRLQILPIPLPFWSNNGEKGNFFRATKTNPL